MLNYLHDLCLLNGISGREDNVRNYIIDKLKMRLRIILKDERRTVCTV